MGFESWNDPGPYAWGYLERRHEAFPRGLLADYQLERGILLNDSLGRTDLSVAKALSLAMGER